MNQVFLLYSLAIGEREPDAEHPFGYGKERFFWSFLAAVGIFVAGAGFSLYEGLQPDLRPETESGSYGIAYAVLAFALPGRGRLARARLAPDAREAAEQPAAYARYVRASRDPTTKTVLFEDSAAVIGVVVAFAGVALYQATGNQVYDGLASVVIARAAGDGRGGARPRHEGAAHRRGGLARGAPGDHRDHRGPPRGRPVARAARRWRSRPTGCWSPRASTWPTVSAPTRSSAPRATSTASCTNALRRCGRCSSMRLRAARCDRLRVTDGQHAAPERPPHRLACQKAISPPAGVATTLRQPAGPSRASSSTTAPRSRARSVAAPISDTST